MTGDRLGGGAIAVRRPGIPLAPGLLLGAAFLTAVLVGALFALNPLYGIAALLSVIYLSLILINLPLGLAAWVPLAFIVAVPKAPLASIALLVVIIVAWLGVLPARRHFVASIIRRNAGLVVALVCLAAWTTASIIWAGDTGAAIENIWNWYIAGAMFAVLATTITRPHHLVLLIIALTAGGVLAAIAGYIPGGEGAATAQKDGRLSGGFGDPNYLAAGIVPVVALAAGLAMATRRRGLRWGLFAALAFLAVSLLATGSRGGVVASGACFVTAIAISRGQRIRLGALVAAAAMILGLWLATTSSGTWDRIREFGGGGTGRVELWSVAWRMSEDHPILGVGVNNFRNESSNYVRRPGQLESVDLITEQPHVVHNIYLQQLAELGVVGLALLLGVVAAALTATWKAVKRLERCGEAQLVIVGRSVLIAQIGALSGSVFISNGYDKVLWIMLALGPILGTIATRAQQVPHEPAG